MPAPLLSELLPLVVATALPFVSSSVQPSKSGAAPNGSLADPVFSSWYPGNTDSEENDADDVVPPRGVDDGGSFHQPSSLVVNDADSCVSFSG